MSDERPPRFPPVDPAASLALPAAVHSPELLASLLADGDDDLAAWTIRSALGEAPRAEVYDGLVSAAMDLVGRRWETGQWSVAEEHLASQTLVRALESVRPSLGPEGRIGPLAVLAGVAGEHHVIGLILLDHLLAETGWTVANLGADVPAPDLGRFVERNEAALVAISASDPGRVAAVAASIAAAQAGAAARLPHLPVMLGGRLAGQTGIVEALDVDWAGETLSSAVAFAGEILATLPANDA